MEFSICVCYFEELCKILLSEYVRYVFKWVDDVFLLWEASESFLINVSKFILDVFYFDTYT